MTGEAMDPNRGAPPWARLRQLALASATRATAREWCELCAAPVPPDHRHLVDVTTRALLCTCRACSLLFDRREAGGAHYRLVPERCRYVEDFALGDLEWAALGLPVEMAFFFFSTTAGRIVAFYPSPGGPTESLLDLKAWGDMQAANPLLATLEPDVEALLVNRARGARAHWIAPIDVCFALVGLIRRRWKGLSGGEEVWSELRRFFEDLHRRSERVDRDGRAWIPRADAGAPEEATWPSFNGSGASRTTS